MKQTRKSAFAGSFYPDNAETLIKLIDSFLPNNSNPSSATQAYIVPHAGYIYSGITAGFAYSRMKNIKDLDTIYILGPSHRVFFKGIALPAFPVFETPLGNLEVNENEVSKWSRQEDFFINDKAHAGEHCLEVQLPFIKYIHKDITIVPALAGADSTPALMKLIETILQTPRTLLIMSSDLSHYKPQQMANSIDKESLRHIENGEILKDSESACGRMIINAFTKCRKRSEYKTELLDYRTSGDTSGDFSSVVGYASMEISQI